jgi:hypothetical protein
MWYEIAIVANIFAVGNILFGHFEEGTPKWRRLCKMLLVMGISVAISACFGRIWFWTFLGCMILPAVYIHAWWLPSRGINGWTGEPKDRYYELRGWTLPIKTQHAAAENGTERTAHSHTVNRA